MWRRMNEEIYTALKVYSGELSRQTKHVGHMYTCVCVFFCLCVCVCLRLHVCMYMYMSL